MTLVIIYGNLFYPIKNTSSLVEEGKMGVGWLFGLTAVALLIAVSYGGIVNGEGEGGAILCGFVFFFGAITILAIKEEHSRNIRRFKQNIAECFQNRLWVADSVAELPGGIVKCRLSRWPRNDCGSGTSVFEGLVNRVKDGPIQSGDIVLWSDDELQVLGRVNIKKKQRR